MRIPVNCIIYAEFRHACPLIVLYRLTLERTAHGMVFLRYSTEPDWILTETSNISFKSRTVCETSEFTYAFVEPPKDFKNDSRYHTVEIQRMNSF